MGPLLVAPENRQIALHLCETRLRPRYGSGCRRGQFGRPKVGQSAAGPSHPIVPTIRIESHILRTVVGYGFLSGVAYHDALPVFGCPQFYGRSICAGAM